MAGNLELLKATWEFIKKNPEKHDQADFINNTTQCGTTMCFAGHAAVLSGAEFPKDDSPWIMNEDGTLAELDSNNRRQGIYVEQYAMDKLGMDYDEVQFIFYHTSNYGFDRRIEHLIELWEKGETYSFGYYDEDEYEDDGGCPCCDDGDWGDDEDDCE